MKLIKILLVLIGLFLFLWEFFPSVVLAPYNAMTHFPVTANGQYILDANEHTCPEGEPDPAYAFPE